MLFPASVTQKTSGTNPLTCSLSRVKYPSGISAGKSAGTCPSASTASSYIAYMRFMVMTAQGMNTTKPLMPYLRSHSCASFVIVLYHSEKSDLSSFIAYQTPV